MNYGSTSYQYLLQRTRLMMKMMILGIINQPGSIFF
jgi:hypothetical protein